MTKMLRVFGLSGVCDTLGFEDEGADANGGEAFIDVMAKFRDQVRAAAIAGANPKVFLDLCDAIRDEVLPPLGIRLEDRGDQSVWKRANAEELCREIALKREEEEKKKLGKLVSKIKDRQKLLAQFEEQLEHPIKAVLASGEYTPYGDEFPELDNQGEPISKSKRTKLVKKFQKSLEKHNKAVEKLAADPELLNAMRKEIAELEESLALLQH